jgi:hypothetical protein
MVQISSQTVPSRTSDWAGLCSAPVLALLLMAACALPAAAQSTRVDLYNRKSERTGGVIVDERTGRVDVYDRDANRLGWGQIDRATGRVDFYRLNGQRVGSGTISGGAIRPERSR